MHCPYSNYKNVLSQTGYIGVVNNKVVLQVKKNKTKKCCVVFIFSRDLQLLKQLCTDRMHNCRGERDAMHVLTVLKNLAVVTAVVSILLANTSADARPDANFVPEQADLRFASRMSGNPGGFKGVWFDAVDIEPPSAKIQATEDIEVMRLPSSCPCPSPPSWTAGKFVFSLFLEYVK
jgi:hypothetical protein